jgi:hypothetical protein
MSRSVEALLLPEPTSYPIQHLIVSFSQFLKMVILAQLKALIRVALADLFQ